LDFEGPEDIYPLSPMQQGMLFHSLQSPESGVCFEQDVYTVHGQIDVARFRSAWEQVVHRHPVLRTTFLWEDIEEPHQLVHRQGEVDLQMDDWRDIPSVERQQRLREYLLSERRSNFELTALPLMRFHLFRLAEDRCWFVWNYQHMILDGWSVPLLMDEVVGVYEASLREAPFDLPARRPYRDFIAWMLGQDMARAKDYWRRRLNGFTVPTPLTVDKRTLDDGLASDESFQSSFLEISTSLTESLTSFSRKHRLTPSTLVQGAWALLLGRYAAVEEVVFGCNVSGRSPDLEGAGQMVGLFINTLPVRVPTSPQTPLMTWLKSIQSQVIEALDYSFTPLVDIQKWSDVPGGQTLFDSIVVVENFPKRLHDERSSIEYRVLSKYTRTGYPLTLIVWPGEQLTLELQFDQRRFDETTIQRMLGHLKTLLSSMTRNSDSRIGALHMLEEGERTELLTGFSRLREQLPSPQLPFDGRGTLCGLFEAQVARRPDAVALTCEGQSLTYAQLNARANQLARRLVQSGVRPDTLVGLCLDRSNELVISILAILKAGGAYLPIDLAYPADRLAFMLEDAQAPVLLTHSNLLGSLPETKSKVICIDEELAHPALAGEKDNLPSTATPDNLAYVIYTSGTTGKPKGSLITQRNVVRLFSATEHWYGFSEQDVWTLFHSTAFDFSVWEIWGALLYGGRVVVVPFMVSRSPEACYELLSREHVTVLNQTPSAFRQLIQAEEAIGQKDLALRYVIFGGEALEMQSLRPWFDRHGDRKPLLVNMYGITETTVHVTYRPLSKDDLDSGSVIGVPIPDLQVYILDAQRQLVPIGVPGEMYVGGAGLARGYLRRPELTEERFIPDHVTGRPESRLYKTGDLARISPGRDIEYLGRIDDQVKIRGFRIELGEIESVLCQHSAIREATVIAREDVPGTKRLVAYIVASAPVPEVGALREHLKQKLPEYMVPSAFVYLDQLPLTASGKIDRKVLPVPDHRPELANSFTPPRTAVEEKLAAVWSKVLRLPQVGVTDNFFELGGDSILSIQVISLARREGLKLTPKLLFANQTIAELATIAGIGVDAPPAEDVVAGDVPLTPIQHWFFEQNLEEPHHYNQAFMFKVKEALDRSLLEAALNELNRHHDVLRFRYVRDANGWRQSLSNSEEPVSLVWRTVQHAGEIEAVAASIQATLHLEKGPIWRVAYFDMDSDQPGRLLIVAHHLAVDGVSWRTLLEDLETAYHQLKSGQPVRLPARTTSFGAWAKKLNEFAKSQTLRTELPYWIEVTSSDRVAGAIKPLDLETSVENTEGAARTLKVRLPADDTRALLHDVPGAYNTQINDALLTALARAWEGWTGSPVLFTNMEGHGRENLFEDVDSSRTVGWYTSIFPVCLTLPETRNNWQPGEALKSIKEQLRQIPQHGIGYGILRYLNTDSGLPGSTEPRMVFNYLGQFDQVVSESRIFCFGAESTGPWHSHRQRRRHALEINCLVIDGCLEVAWTYNQSQHSETSIRRLADEFSTALKSLIVHCQSAGAGGRTPSDFPLAGLDQAALDRIIPQISDIEDIYRLSPIQTLFYSANPGASQAAFDHWHCTLRGALDASAYQRAWEETIRRHTVLRSTIHEEGLREPLQIVHRDVQLPWIIEDWRGSSYDRNTERWSTFLKNDLAQPLILTNAPVMRFALIRLTDTTWKFLWSIPALLLDGWSWPVVFRDASRLYETFSRNASSPLGPVRPYRDYIAWLREQSTIEANDFWTKYLAGFHEPTQLQSDIPDSGVEVERYQEFAIPISAAVTEELQSMARRLQVTLNTLVQGIWALLLSHQCGAEDVVFGAAFSGRPADLHGVESIVGPFVNNLPVRISVTGEWPASDFFRTLHLEMLRLSSFQFSPLMEIQRCSEVPWRYRLFESLVVFQNYLVDDSARSFGGKIDIAEFRGPIHTNYAVMLLAEPGAVLDLKLIYDRRVVGRATVENWGRDIAALMGQLSNALDKNIAQLRALFSTPVRTRRRATKKLYAETQNYVPPQTEMERSIAGVWQKVFELEQVSIEDNIFDLGGRSLLLVQIHSQLREVLKMEFPLLSLFEYPTIQSLAGHLGHSTEPASKNGKDLRDRAQRQKQALAQFRKSQKNTGI
jgi:amino acid adenylation domain-containing protein/non-ribosomal peptide synthase protein (TIGR01720 family)